MYTYKRMHLTMLYIRLFDYSFVLANQNRNNYYARVHFFVFEVNNVMFELRSIKKQTVLITVYVEIGVCPSNKTLRYSFYYYSTRRIRGRATRKPGRIEFTLGRVCVCFNDDGSIYYIFYSGGPSLNNFNRSRRIPIRSDTMEILKIISIT